MNKDICAQRITSFMHLLYSFSLFPFKIHYIHNNEPETPERGDPPLHYPTENNEPETLKEKRPAIAYFGLRGCLLHESTASNLMTRPWCHFSHGGWLSLRYSCNPITRLIFKPLFSCLSYLSLMWLAIIWPVCSPVISISYDAHGDLTDTVFTEWDATVRIHAKAGLQLKINKRVI